MPDQPSPRRRFQFGLRLAMLLVTLICVVASWIGWMQYKAHLDKAGAGETRIGDDKGSTTLKVFQGDPVNHASDRGK